MVSTFAVLLLRIALSGVLGETAPLLLFMIAIVAAAYTGGFWPGLLATFLSTIIGAYWFVEVRGELIPARPENQLYLFLFFSVGTVISVLYERLHQAHREIVLHSAEMQAKRDAETWIARYEDAVRASGSIIYDCDRTSRQAILGGDCQGVLGYPADELSGDLEKWIALIHPDDRAAFAREIERTDTDETPAFIEYRMRHRDGRTVWMRDEGRATRDGPHLRYVGVAKDVTAQRQAEAALRESEQRFRAYMDNTPMLAWAKDADGRYVYMNRTYEEQFSVRLEDFLGRTDFEKWPAELARQYSQNDQTVLATGMPLESLEDTVDQRGKHLKWRCIKFIYTDAAGRKYVGGTGVDVTQQLRTQEELRQLADRLADMDRRKNEFMAMLAHELRNPIAPIRTGIELMKVAYQQPETLVELQAMMERQIRQLITLVDDLLDMSRVTQGKLKLRKALISVAEVVRSAVEASQMCIQEGRHELTVSLPEQVVTVNADPNRLAQIVSNLLNNAAKYTPERGHIWLTVVLDGNDVVISVRDTGIGIPAELQGRIFELFAQVEGRLSERGTSGLGIGLTLVKTLIEMHGGTVEIRSEGENRGSEFRIRMPVATEGALDQAPPGKVAAPGPEVHHRVLVVDDNRAAVMAMRHLVHNLGHDVRTAADGQDAIEVARDFLPDVVLMDIGMPRMNGYEAAKIIRQHLWGQKMVLVALTGWGQDEDRVKAREAGFDHHLVKPAEPAELRRLLNSIPERA